MPLDGDHVTFLKDVRDQRRRRNEKVWSPCPYYFINTINCHELFLSVTVCGEEKGQTNLISINHQGDDSSFVRNEALCIYKGSRGMFIC